MELVLVVNTREFPVSALSPLLADGQNGMTATPGMENAVGSGKVTTKEDRSSAPRAKGYQCKYDYYGFLCHMLLTPYCTVGIFNARLGAISGLGGPHCLPTGIPPR
jgi:hypothetical protein